MTFKTLTMTALLATAAAMAGCSDSGSSGGGGGVASTAPGATAGQISSALPTAARDANGYNIQPFFTPTTTLKGGSITAMEVAAIGTQSGVIVADSPFSNISAVASGSSTFETKLFFDATSFATTTSGSVVTTFAATANRNAPGAGDLWSRDATGAWKLAYDSRDNEATVAVLGSNAWAATGTEGGSTTVLMDQGGWNSVATIQSRIPTTSIGHDGEYWVGGSDSALTGGSAYLYHGSGTTFDELPMPSPTIGANVFQRVTSMVSVATVATTGKASMKLLFVSVAEFDINGAALGGRVLLTDGTDFETLKSFTNDAPLSMIWADDTIYVGTASGELLFRDAKGDWQNDSVLANTGIHTMALEGDKLYLGVSTSAGAAVFLRTGGQAGPVLPPVTPPTPQDLYYDTDVAMIMASRCAACHDGTLPAASADFPLSDPADNTTDHAEILKQVNLMNSAGSQLLLKATNDSSAGAHGGGAIFTATSAEYATIQKWIDQGAKLTKTTTPPPAPKKSFAVDVHPLLKADCMGCHANGTGGYRVNNDVNASFTAATGQVVANNPENSLLLRKPSRDGGLAHGGGLVGGWAKGSAKYNLVLQWIADGTQQ